MRRPCRSCLFSSSEGLRGAPRGWLSRGDRNSAWSELPGASGWPFRRRIALADRYAVSRLRLQSGAVRGRTGQISRPVSRALEATVFANLVLERRQDPRDGLCPRHEGESKRPRAWLRSRQVWRLSRQTREEAEAEARNTWKKHNLKRYLGGESKRTLDPDGAFEEERASETEVPLLRAG